MNADELQLFHALAGDAPDLRGAITEVRTACGELILSHNLHLAAAYAYPRKDELSFDSILGERNPLYGSRLDPIRVSISFDVVYGTALHADLAHRAAQIKRDALVRAAEEADEQARIARAALAQFDSNN